MGESRRYLIDLPNSGSRSEEEFKAFERILLEEGYKVLDLKLIENICGGSNASLKLGSGSNGSEFTILSKRTWDRLTQLGYADLTIYPPQGQESVRFNEPGIEAGYTYCPTVDPSWFGG